MSHDVRETVAQKLPGNKPLPLDLVGPDFVYTNDYSFIHNRRRDARVCVFVAPGFTGHPARWAMIKQLNSHPEIQVLGAPLPGLYGDPKNEFMLDLMESLKGPKEDMRKSQQRYQRIARSITEFRLQMLEELVAPGVPIFVVGTSAGAGLNHMLVANSGGRIHGAWHDSSVAMPLHRLLEGNPDEAIERAAHFFGEEALEYEGLYGQMPREAQSSLIASAVVDDAVRNMVRGHGETTRNFVKEVRHVVDEPSNLPNVIRGGVRVATPYIFNHRYMGGMSHFCSGVDVSGMMAQEGRLGNGYWTMLTGGSKDGVATPESFAFERRVLGQTVMAALLVQGKPHAWLSQGLTAGSALPVALTHLFGTHVIRNAAVMNSNIAKEALRERFAERFEQIVRTPSLQIALAESAREFALQQAPEVATSARAIQHGYL